MSPVSSSTFTCASARWRSICGSMCDLGQLRGWRELGAGRHDASTAAASASSSPSSPGIGSTSTRPGHGFTTREQREVLAQRVALELGREVEVAQRGVAVEHDAEHLPLSRSCQSAPGYTGTHDSTSIDSSSTSVLSVMPQCRDGRLHVREHLEAAVGAGDAVGGLLRLHRRRRVAQPSSTIAGRRHPVDAGDEREVVAAERVLGDLGGCAPRVAAHAHDRRRRSVGAVLEDRVAELGLEARHEHPACAVVERVRIGRDRFGRLGLDASASRSSVSGVGAGHVSQRRSAPRATAARARRCRCPRSGCAPAAARCPG